MEKKIIISPSGKLYGSENVLLDFLKTTQNIYTVFVKGKGLLYDKAKKDTKHTIRVFKSEKIFYLKLLFILFFENSIKTIYLNEGGHIKYVKLFSIIFKKRKFIVHIRIKEDTNIKRIGSLKRNIKLIVISQYLMSLIEHKYNSALIYDPYRIIQTEKDTNIKTDVFFKIGIIGRVTKTKELDNLFYILDSLSSTHEKNIRFVFFGNYNEDDIWFKKFKEKLLKYTDFEYEFKGFMKKQEQIYNQINLVIHLNTVEALGRIVFEAVEHNVPIITFDKGGTGELMNKLKLNKLIVKKENNWPNRFAEKIIGIINGDKYESQILTAKKIIIEDFTPEQYINQIEQIFQE